jgi:hypothetical protein
LSETGAPPPRIPCPTAIGFTTAPAGKTGLASLLAPWISRAAIVCLSLVGSLLLIEVALRTFPSLLGHPLGNEIYGRYGAFPGGMYFVEPITRINFMRPDFETQTYWNGYHWHHRTDSRGFRNPPGTSGSDVLLLGDSLIYGHGIEEEQTVAHLLRHDYGHTVYNMGRQGGYLYEYYVLLRLYLRELHPKAVVLFVFLNDLTDLESGRSGAEIVEVPEITRYDYVAIRKSMRAANGTSSPLSRQVYFRSGALRLLHALIRNTFGAPRTTPEMAEGQNPVHPMVRPVFDSESFGRITSYYDRILVDLDQRCRAGGARLLLIFLEYPFPGVRPDGPDRLLEGQKKAEDFLHALAQRRGLRFFSTGALFQDWAECFLQDDGHFSAVGHRRLARFVHERLTE